MVSFRLLKNVSIGVIGGFSLGSVLLLIYTALSDITSVTIYNTIGLAFIGVFTGVGLILGLGNGMEEDYNAAQEDAVQNTQIEDLQAQIDALKK